MFDDFLSSFPPSLFRLHICTYACKFKDDFIQLSHVQINKQTKKTSKTSKFKKQKFKKTSSVFLFASFFLFYFFCRMLQLSDLHVLFALHTTQIHNHNKNNMIKTTTRPFSIYFALIYHKTLGHICLLRVFIIVLLLMQLMLLLLLFFYNCCCKINIMQFMQNVYVYMYDEWVEWSVLFLLADYSCKYKHTYKHTQTHIYGQNCINRAVEALASSLSSRACTNCFDNWLWDEENIK